ncbi:porin [Vibrio sp. WJH972]
MKKSILALAIATFATPSVFAAGTFESDISGGIGGYYDTDTEAFYDDWATAVTVSTNYTNGNVVGYFEMDLEFNWTDDEDASGISNDTTTDVDKAWLGYKTEAGVLSYGWENDTALDKVDGAGDQTVEFGSSAGDTSDAFDVIKFEGSSSGVAYGISYFKVGDNTGDSEAGVNGYLGYKADTFAVYAGLEEQDEYSVTSLSGNASFGAVTVGANAWINDPEGGDEETGIYASAGFAVSDALTLSAGYVAKSFDVADDYDAINVAASYDVSDVVTVQGDIKDDGDRTDVFLVAYYDF